MAADVGNRLATTDEMVAVYRTCKRLFQAQAPLASASSPTSLPELVDGIAAIVAARRQTRRGDEIGTGATVQQVPDEPIAAVGRKTQPESFDRFGLYTTTFEIIAGLATIRTGELLLEPARGFLQHVIECCGAFLMLAFLGSLAWHLHARHARQTLDRLGEGKVLRAHDKADDIAMSTTAKAVEEPLVLDHGKRRRLFTMERAKTRELTSAPLQAHLLPHDVGQGNSGANLVKELWGKGHGSL